MKKIILLCLLSLLLLAEENPKGYVNFDFCTLLFQSTGVNKNFTPKGVKWTAGYNLKKFTVPYLDMEINSAIEGLMITSTGSSTQNNSIGLISDVNYGEITATLGHLYAMHLKTPLSIGERLDINIFLGTSHSEMILQNENFDTLTNTNTSLSYGLGVEYMLPKNISTHASFIQYFNNLSSIELGLGVKF